MTRPNVIYLMTDDQGYGDLACLGNPVIQTPEIDRLYAESLRLTNYHVGPTCAPTRAGLMTGHYATSAGVWHTIGGRSLLRKDERTMGTIFGENDYRTGIFGKWHLGDNYPYRPQDRGFQKTVVHGGGGISQSPDHWGNCYFDDTYYRNGEAEKFEGYCTDVFFNEAMRFIEENREQPFFCYLPTNAPHYPYNVEEEYYKIYQGKIPDDRARFYGMITNIDKNVGILRTRLEELGLKENTIFIFSTDNGTDCGAKIDGESHVVDGYNAGMRGIKNSPYEGGHRVPLFLHWPAGGYTEGRDLDALAANIDVLPTLLDMCDIDISKESFHGMSLKNIFEGEGDDPERVVVTDTQRLVLPKKWHRCCAMNKRWRLLMGEELYDMDADPGQREDVSDNYPEIVSKLRAEYEKWWEMVSFQMEAEVPIDVGAEAVEETRLCAHDLRNEACDVAWNQGQVRKGYSPKGYWEVDVKVAGTYEIGIRRWSKEEGSAMRAKLQDDDIGAGEVVIDPQCHEWYTGSVAMDLVKARVEVAGQSLETSIVDGDIDAKLALELATGPAHLAATLIAEDGSEYGAFYAYIKRLS